MKSLNELARGQGIPESKLNDQLRRINDRRRIHRLAPKKGMSMDKNSPWMAESAIPLWLWCHPEFKDTWFSNDQDPHEREKHLKQIESMYPELRTRD